MQSEAHSTANNLFNFVATDSQSGVRSNMLRSRVEGDCVIDALKKLLKQRILNH